MTTPLFNRTGSDNFSEHLKMMISGPPKSGKTTLLGTVPNIVVADTEPHANNLQSIAHKDVPYVTVNGSEDLRKLHLVLSNKQFREGAAQQLGMPSIDAVAIDTADTLQGILKKERMRETRKRDFQRDDWGWLKEEMTSILQMYLSLPMHVIIVVHTKIKDIGTESKPRSIILPGLEGAIAESIAGMVGYSMLSFREEASKADGSKYTRYKLRVEGDETYEYLGNRTAGRLPDVIDPDFPTILRAAMSGRPTRQQTPVQITATEAAAVIQPPASTPQPAPQAAAAPAPVAQNAGQAQAAPGAAAPEPAAAPAPSPTPPKEADTEPINPAAMGHLKKVYDAVGLTFDQDLISSKLTMGDARTAVKMWKACQQEEAEGKGGPAKPAMIEYLAAMDFLIPTELAAVEKDVEAFVAGQDGPKAGAEAKIDGTIQQVMAYAGDSLERVQEAFDFEKAKDKPRSSLLDALTNKGAKDTTVNAAVATPAEVPTPVQNEAPEQAEPAVTPAETPADAEPTEEQAVATVKEVLGATEVPAEPAAPSTPMCAEGGDHAIDDTDIADVSQARFGRQLCVEHYIAETKKPKA